MKTKGKGSYCKSMKAVYMQNLMPNTIN